MKTQWEKANEQTKRKMEQAVVEEEPDQSNQFWQSLVTWKSLGQHPFSDDEEHAVSCSKIGIYVYHTQWYQLKQS